MKVKWIIWAERGLLLTVVLAISVLTFLNVRDYRRYKFITELERHVTPEQFAAMARVCDVKERREFKSYKGAAIPVEFAALSPLDVSASWGLCDVKLYERGLAYAYLRINSSPRNQRAHVFYNFDGDQRGHDVWLRDPAAEEPFHPKGRLLTIGTWSLDESRRYVITGDLLLVIETSGTVGRQDEILFRRELDSAERQRVRETIARIPQANRGKIYTTGAADGLTMHLAFSEDGSPSGDDMQLDNAWCDAVAEIVGVISGLVPAELRLPGRDELYRWEHGSVPTHVYTNVEWAKRGIIPFCDYPWWLIWPRLALGVKG